jgi:hypothetical protein
VNSASAQFLYGKKGSPCVYCARAPRSRVSPRPEASFAMHLNPGGECTISEPTERRTATMTVGSGDLVKLLNGEVWYSALVGDGRLAVRSDDRGLRIEFLRFLLDFE